MHCPTIVQSCMFVENVKAGLIMTTKKTGLFKVKFAQYVLTWGVVIDNEMCSSKEK